MPSTLFSKHSFRRFGRAPVITMILLCLGALAPRSQAQLTVEMSLDKKIYVAYEPIKVQVQVTNRAGRDIVLGGPGGTSWLSFDVATDKDDRIFPSGVTPFAASTSLPAGKSITRHISLGKSYALGKPRNYRVKASVYFAGTSQYISSRPTIFSITEANRIWEKVVGIPQDKRGGGGYRHYQVMTFRDTERTQLYVRVTDTQTKRVLACYSLGRFIEVVNPQVAVDSQNRMHVLFLGAPHTYSHKTINYDGETLTADIYRDELGSPRLMESESGSVSVQGGSLFDPSTPNPAAETGSGQFIRRLSDRPEGMPRTPRAE